MLAVIPLVIRGDCRRSDEKEPAEAVARLRCQPPDLDGGYVGYSLFDSASAVNQYMNPRLSLGDKAGVCGHDASGVSTYRNTEKEAIGRLLCHLDDDDDAWIEWTNIQLNVYAYAYRFDSNWKALFNFWNNAGPNAANGS